MFRIKCSDSLYKLLRRIKFNRISLNRYKSNDFPNRNRFKFVKTFQSSLQSPEDNQRNNRKKSVMNKKNDLLYHGEIVHGLHPVHLALKGKKREFYHLYIKETDSDEGGVYSKPDLKKKIKNLASQLDIEISSVKSNFLTSLCQGQIHQGVCLDASSYPLLTYTSQESDEEITHTEKPPLWILLSEIQDPMNVGAILRSAFYFGVDKIFMTANDSCRLSPTVSKASSGALELLNIYYIYNIMDFLQEKKNHSWQIVSTSAYNRLKDEKSMLVDLIDFQLSAPTILILGNESKGISSAIESVCDNFITIHPRNSVEDVDSLNVSAATAITLYHLLYRAKTAEYSIV